MTKRVFVSVEDEAERAGYRARIVELTDKVRRLGNIPTDEPIFVLRAQDCLALAVVEQWLQLAENFGVSKQKIADAHALHSYMVEWQESHSTKLPD